ncbi:glycoside hydrolase family 28 protein [Tellurirhabdus rosea]|uniref:glycoside hydrolase family 28 protein n=1 Tax=Tellurirhabdus rosea TaxID=2674997 RepID=UPI00225003CD|nr:glycoside hydrolase family 28 protein [Tellurirhabdus rosea]
MLLFLSFLAFWLTAPEPWQQQVGARTQPKQKTVFLTTTYGAVGDGKTLNTAAIQKTIDACAAKGGGVVAFKPGQYLTGSLFLKKGVTFRLDKGVELLGSQSLADYPEMDTRVAGLEMKWPAALLNVIDQQNVAIVGEGTVNAQGKPFWDSYWALRKDYEKKGLRWIVDYDAKRPRTLLVQNCANVTLKGITLQQAGFWTVHILYSKHVTADGLVIRNNIGGHGPSTDGIDIDSSEYILVQNCDIDCNDDNFCLKSGRDWDGLRVNRPTQYVVIRNCISRAGGGLITFGSETSGGIRHVLAQNLEAKGTGVGIRLKSATTRGGTVEDITLENIRMEEVGVAMEATMNWNPSYSYSTLPAGYTEETLPVHWKKMLTKVEPVERGIPHFRNVTIRQLRVSNARKAITAEGLESSLLENFRLEDVQVTANSAGTISFGKNWKLTDVKIEAKDAVVVKKSNGVTF